MRKIMRTGDQKTINRGSWIEAPDGNLYEIAGIKTSQDGENLAVAIEILLDDPDRPTAYRYGDMAATLTAEELQSCERYAITSPCSFSA